MEALARNQLVWLDPGAWALIEARVWDAQAHEILAHWRTQRLPLVVCRQRTQTPPDQVCVGLPAPQQWSRRRLALNVSLDDITACGKLPTLAQVARDNQWGAMALELSEALARMGAPAYVYGSYGWQWLTGLTYLHDASDLDLSLNVRSFAIASQAVARLASAEFHCRIDGEIVFPQGQAIAWRELHQLLQGRASQVLLKGRNTLRLAALEEVCRLAHGAREAKPEEVLVKQVAALCLP